MWQSKWEAKNIYTMIPPPQPVKSLLGKKKVTSSTTTSRGGRPIGGRRTNWVESIKWLDHSTLCETFLSGLQNSENSAAIRTLFRNSGMSGPTPTASRQVEQVKGWINSIFSPLVQHSTLRTPAPTFGVSHASRLTSGAASFTWRHRELHVATPWASRDEFHVSFVWHQSYTQIRCVSMTGYLILHGERTNTSYSTVWSHIGPQTHTRVWVRACVIRTPTFTAERDVTDRYADLSLFPADP